MRRLRQPCPPSWPATLLFLAVITVAVGPAAQASIDLSAHVLKVWGWPVMVPVDIDRDGIDEMLASHLDILYPNTNLVDTDQRVRWALRYPSEGSPDNVPYTVDANGDGDLELVLSMRTDSTYSVFIFTGDLDDPEFERVLRLPLPPDRTDDGYWDGAFTLVGSLDADDDSDRDILLRVGTSYDLQPRGFIAYDTDGDSVVWQFFFGPQIISPPTIIDVDGDGDPEILTTTHAPCNRSDANGLMDTLSGVLLFSHTGELLWHRVLGGRRSMVIPWTQDSLDRERMEITVLKSPGPAPEKQHELFRINLRTGTIIARASVPNPAKDGLRVLDCEPKWRTQLGLVAVSAAGRIWRWTRDLELIEYRSFPVSASVPTIADVDRDGSPEFLVDEALDGSVRIYNRHFVELAHANTNSHRSTLRFLSRGDAIPGLLLLQTGGRKSIIEIPRFPIPSVAFLDELVTQRWGIPVLTSLYRSPLVDWTSLRARQTGWALLGMITTPFSLMVLLAALATARQMRVSRLRQELAGIPEALDFAVIAVTRKGRVSYVNEHALRWLGLSGRRWRNQKAATVFDRAGGLAPLGAYLAQQVRDQHRTPLTLRIGSEPQHFEIVPARAAKGSHMGWQLFRLERLTAESPGNVAAAWFTNVNEILHQLKSPIDKAREQLGMLDAARLMPEDENRIERIREQLVKSRNLIVGLATLFPKSTSPVHYLLSPLLEDIAREIRHEILRHDVRLRTDCDPTCDDIGVFIDRSLFRTAFLDLVSNAQDSCGGEGGEIVIRASVARGLQAPPVAEIAVIDHGCGMTVEECDRAFDIGVTTKNGGTGLGLPKAKRIVESFGGTLSVQSVVDSGTTVTIRLPVEVRGDEDGR